MRKVYLISYDLGAPNRDYSGLYGAIKVYEWWHYLESTWLIATTESTGQVWNRLVKHVDRNDRIIIIEVVKNFTGWLPQDAWDWINNNAIDLR